MNWAQATKNLNEARNKYLNQTPPRQRLLTLFDPDSYKEIGGFVSGEDKPASLVCGYGTIQGLSAYAFSQQGGLGPKEAAKMKKVYQLARKNGAPIIGLYDSNGLSLGEGPKVMADFGELLGIQNNLSGVVPQISVVLGPCIGLNAMLACSADFLIMSESGAFFATPPTSQVPDDLATALSAAEAGVAHIVANSQYEALEAVRKLCSFLPANNLATLPKLAFTPPPLEAGAALVEAAQNIQQVEAWAVVHPLIDELSQIQLFPHFGQGVYAVMASIDGSPWGILATKGGRLTGDDCSKIARLVQVWDSYNIPILTLINTEGMAATGGGAARDMAKVAHVYAEATTPKIAVVTGPAYGAAFVALGLIHTDVSLAWPSSIISSLPPATAVAFSEGGRLSKDKPRAVLEEEYRLVTASGLAAAQEGLVDQVILPEETRSTILDSLAQLQSKRVSRLSKKHGNMPF